LLYGQRPNTADGPKGGLDGVEGDHPALRSDGSSPTNACETGNSGPASVLPGHWAEQFRANEIEKTHSQEEDDSLVTPSQDKPDSYSEFDEEPSSQKQDAAGSASSDAAGSAEFEAYSSQDEDPPAHAKQEPPATQQTHSHDHATSAQTPATNTVYQGGVLDSSQEANGKQSQPQSPSKSQSQPQSPSKSNVKPQPAPTKDQSDEDVFEDNNNQNDDDSYSDEDFEEADDTKAFEDDEFEAASSSDSDVETF